MIGFTLRGPTLGDTVVRVVVALLVVTALVLIVGSLAFGKLGWWRAEVWQQRAETADQAARTAQANAESANAGAANATQTRSQMDAGTVTVRVETEAAAQRIEEHANHPSPVVDLEPVDAGVLRELEAAETRARAAADRLQRKGPG